VAGAVEKLCFCAAPICFSLSFTSLIINQKDEIIPKNSKIEKILKKIAKYKRNIFTDVENKRIKQKNGNISMKRSGI
jgi:hypothetical protein